MTWPSSDWLARCRGKSYFILSKKVATLSSRRRSRRLKNVAFIPIQNIPHLPHMPAELPFQKRRERQEGRDSVSKEELGKLPNPLLLEGLANPISVCAVNMVQ